MISESKTKRLPVLCPLVLFFLLLVIYYPSLSTGFFADDYNFLEPAVRLNLGEYLTRYFDPSASPLWYRPLQGIQILLEYKLFGVNPAPYHVVQILIHWVNCLLLFALIQRISGRQRLAILSTLLYATFPVYALAVNWINITDPLMTIFYLLAIWLWWNHLQSGGWRYFILTHLAFIVALLTKQMAVSLPLILFALDRLVVRDRVSVWQLAKRYSLLVLILGGYVLLQNSISSTHVYAGVFSYTFGLGVASILLQYFSLMTFPWGYFPPTDTQITEGLPFVEWGNILWVALSLSLYLAVTIRRRSGVLAFLGVSILLVLAPVLFFPFVELRYLYLPSMAVAILFVLGLQALYHRLSNPPWTPHFTSAALGLLVIGGGLSIASANAGIFEIARQRRVPFRDIAFHHPTFPQDTYLFFVEPVSPVYELSGMFTLRYGPGVIVGGTGRPHPTYLHSHKNAFVYYFDDTGAPHELVAEPGSNLAVTPPLPASFGGMIVLDNFELARTEVKRASALVAIFYWRAAARIDKNYTVFVHLLDKDGKIVASYDSQPGNGKLPTIDWHVNQRVVDAIAMPIAPDVAVGEGLRLEIGLYDFRTLQRLPIVDDKGTSLTDHLTLEPLRIVE